MNKLLIALISVIALVSLPASKAYAWNFTVSGAAVCNTTTGNWDVTWTINNPESEELTVAASDRASVPVSSTVAMNTSKGFNESLPGTTSGDQSLTVKVEWPSDKTQPPKTTKVSLDGTCKKPEVLAATTNAAPTTTTPSPTPTSTLADTAQVSAVPAGGVGAGGGGAVNSNSSGALLGLTTSLAVLGFGLFSLKKQLK